MTTQNLALFQGMGAKMEYLNARQRVISQNIANSDTPGYRAHDIKSPDFNSVLKSVTKGSSRTVSLTPVATNSGHITGDNIINARAKEQKNTYEVAPIENSVSMEEQMIKSQATTMDYNLMTNLYRKNVSMLKTAIGSR